MVMYLVTWVLTTFVPVPCPDFKPDAYGIWPTVRCSVNHVESVDSPMQKMFEDLDQAQAFVKEAPPSAHDFKIEEWTSAIPAPRHKAR